MPRRSQKGRCRMTGVSPSNLIQEINQWQEAYEKLQLEKMELFRALKNLIETIDYSGTASSFVRKAAETARVTLKKAGTT